MKQQIKLIERKVKSVLTIGERSKHSGFLYTKELIEEIIKQQQPLIENKTLFVTLGYFDKNLTDTDIDKVEGFVTGVEIVDNKVEYTIHFLEKAVNLYLNMNIPMSIEIPIRGKIIDNKYVTEVEIMNYVDMIFDNPEQTIKDINNMVDSIKEVIAKIEVK